MPVLDGYQATDAVRSRERSGSLPRLPIVAMTANAMPGDRERCLAAGMDDYLSKPIKREVLQQVLAKFLKPKANPVLNQDALAQLREIFSGDIQSVIQTFLDDAPAYIEQIACAVGSANFDQLRGAAHSLKSSSVSVGAAQLGTIAAALEHLARTENDALRADALLGQLQAAFRDAEPQLRAAAAA